jgi:FdrA protein
MSIAIKIFPDTYVDSVVQLRGMRAMREIGDVEWASAAMATPANIETLRAEGVAAGDVEGVGANDLFIVARARDEETASKALAVGEAAVLSANPVADGGQQPKAPRSLREAMRVQVQRRGDLGAGDYAAWLPTRRCPRTFTCSCSVTTCRCTRRSPSRTTRSAAAGS